MPFKNFFLHFLGYNSADILCKPIDNECCKNGTIWGNTATSTYESEYFFHFDFQNPIHHRGHRKSRAIVYIPIFVDNKGRPLKPKKEYLHLIKEYQRRSRHNPLCYFTALPSPHCFWILMKFLSECNVNERKRRFLISLQQHLHRIQCWTYKTE